MLKAIIGKYEIFLKGTFFLILTRSAEGVGQKIIWILFDSLNKN